LCAKYKYVSGSVREGSVKIIFCGVFVHPRIVKVSYMVFIISNLVEFLVLSSGSVDY
jgi:hypothetical protein